MDPTTRSRITTGAVLIVLGLGLYAMQYLGELGESLTLLFLGGLGIAGYLFGRSYFLLVVGGIVFGLGVGSLGERTAFIVGEFTKIGLGIGFVLIYLIHLLYEKRSVWWPLIPGAILLLLGFRAWREFRIFITHEGWPLILVIIGVLMILGALGRARSSPRPQPQDGP